MTLGGQLRRLGKHSAIYGLGGLVSRILAVLLLPLYTRNLSPSDYGKVETLIALTTVIGIVLRMGIHSAFFRFYFDSKEPADRRRVVRTSFWPTMAMATAGLTGGLLLVAPISDLLFGSSGQLATSDGGIRQVLGGDELRAAHVALPRRGALGRLRLGQPREHPSHDRRDAPPRRRPRQGADPASSSATSSEP